MPLTIGIPKEVFAGEKRVATIPDVVEKLIKLGFKVAVETGAGDSANFSDDAYQSAGAGIVSDAPTLWATSDVVFKVRAPSSEEVGLLREGGTLISFVWPAQNPELMQQLAARKATVLAIDSLPRTLSRAQKMDALTSQAGVAGYRAVIEAANAFGRFFNGQITAAGKVPPAKVFIAGAGVAGLAAIGTAANLGAIVRANDTRAEVADQVVSLGGDGSVMACDEGIFRGRAPKIEVVNPVGAGDTLVGCFAVALARKLPAPECLRFAMSRATANCLSPSTGRFDPDIASSLMEKTTVEPLS